MLLHTTSREEEVAALCHHTKFWQHQKHADFEYLLPPPLTNATNTTTASCGSGNTGNSISCIAHCQEQHHACHNMDINHCQLSDANHLLPYQQLPSASHGNS